MPDAGPDRRHQRPHRPDLLGARLAGRLRRPEAPRAAGPGARRAAAHRRRRRLAQPLRPPRRAERARRSPRRPAGRRSSSCRSASRPGSATPASPTRSSSTGGRATRVGAVEIVLDAGAALVGPLARRPHGDALGRLRDLRAPTSRSFFAGDTGYSKDFADIHARFAARHGAGRGFDLALIPIGAYEPRWFMSAQHVDPAEAVQIHLDLARAALDRHPLGHLRAHRRVARRAAAGARRGRRASAASPTTRSRVMAIGETRRFAPRAP